MADTAAHLVDHVFPEVPVRQWVLSVPYGLRYRLAYDSSLLRDVLQIFVRAVFASIRRRAGLSASNRRARCGAVTFIQRFSDALNLDPHLHSLALDGIYVENGSGEPVFRPGPRPARRPCPIRFSSSLPDDFSRLCILDLPPEDHCSKTSSLDAVDPQVASQYPIYP